jgi:hypothetical protein
MLKLDTSDIIDLVHQAWQETIEEIETANRTAIQAWRYDWPRTTVRQNGDIVSTPRDIVDTANLLESQYVLRINSDRFEFGWDVDYAAAVHEGATTRSDTHLPARRWTQAAIRGDTTAPGEWQNPQAILDVPAHFTQQFRRISRPS